MPDDDVQPDPVEAPDTETPSEDGAPEGEELEETTSDDSSEVGDAPPDESDETEPPQDADGDSDEDEAWRNFQKKFEHIKSERDRRAAMGRAYWEKTRWASQVRKRAEDLEKQLAALSNKEEAPPKEEEPETPHPDIAKLDQRIQSLVQKDNSLVQNQQELLGALREVDEEIVRWKTKAEDADEYNKALYEQKGETAKIRKSTLLQRWGDINDRREQLSYDVERLMSDRNWVEQFVRNEQQKKALEARSIQEFNQSFPRFVDSQIAEIATELGAPDVKDLREDLRTTVRERLTVALWKMSQKQVDDVDVPELVRDYVKGYLKRNDLLNRSKFTEASKKKLAVSGGKATPAVPPSKAKPAPGKPVRLAQLSKGELSPAMARAREYLASRGL